MAPASRDTVRLLFDVHSWAGVVTGVLMFIVCFSGAVVVFKHEIDLWANPSLRALPHPERPASLDRVLAQVQAGSPGARIDFIALPDGISPAFTVLVREPGRPAGERVKLALRGDDGSLVGSVDSQLGQYVRSLHVFLFFGPRWIVGFLGVAMLVLIGTGFVIHRKIIAELFTQRWRRAWRTAMTDLHKAAGIWGLAFHVLIAFTGAWLGLAPVFERAWQFATGAAPPATVAGRPRPATMPSLDALHSRAQQALPDLQVRFVSLRDWGTVRAQAVFTGGLHGHLASTARVAVNAADGSVAQRHDPRTAGFWSTLNGLMEPLHFGDFGGPVLKWLYFVLGMSPAFLSLSGTLIWIDRRRQDRRQAALGRASSAGAALG